MIDRKALKAEAKLRLAKDRPEYLRVMLLYALVAGLAPQVLLTTSSDSPELVSGLSQLIASGVDPQVALSLLQIPRERMMLQFILNVILSVYQMLLRFGLAAYALRLSRGQECGAPELFSGFSMAGRVVGQRLVILGLYMLWAIVLSFPMSAVIMFGVMSGSETIGILFIVAGLVGYVAALMAILLRYELATLALADQPELGVMGTIRYAKALIQGHAGQYFLLILSFLGWSILCALPAFVFSYVLADAAVSPWLVDIGAIVLSLPVYLWLAPYMSTTTAGFYDALQGERTTYCSSPMGEI